MPTPYQVYPGQLFEGSEVKGSKHIFAQPITTTGGIAAGGNVPTVAAVNPGAGTGASISSQAGYDMAGSFVLTAGTGPLTGTMATVTFGSPLVNAPVSVNVTIGNQGLGAATGISGGAVSLAKTGFSVYANAAGTLGGPYLVCYQVFRSPYG
jgi:hypothetical protein